MFFFRIQSTGPKKEVLCTADCAITWAFGLHRIVLSILDAELVRIEVLREVEASISDLWHERDMTGVEDSHTYFADPTLICSPILLKFSVCLISAMCLNVDADKNRILVDEALKCCWNR